MFGERDAQVWYRNFRDLGGDKEAIVLAASVLDSVSCPALFLWKGTNATYNNIRKGLCKRDII